MNATSHRKLAAAAATVGLLAGLSAAASASSPAALTHAHVVRTLGGEIFRPNRSDTFTLRYSQANIVVHSGDRVTFVHADHTQDPHTVSLVGAGDVPRRSDPCPICNRVQAAHFPQGQSAPPLNTVNAGRPGLDVPGDSVLWMKGRLTVQITAPAGTLLHFFCAIHPWMQGTIRVVS